MPTVLGKRSSSGTPLTPPAKLPRYQDMRARSNELGRELARDLDEHEVGRLSDMNSSLEKVWGRQSETYIESTLNIVSEKGDGWYRKAGIEWRKVANATDEFVSTATIIGMLEGMTVEQLGSEGVKLALKIMSGPRLPTRQVGYFIEDEGFLQHITGTTPENGPFFANKQTGAGVMDTQRRVAVLDAGESARGADRIFIMTSKGIVETLGRFASAPLARNINTLPLVTANDLEEATNFRETLKEANNRLINSSLGTQAADADWVRQPHNSSARRGATSPFRRVPPARTPTKYFLAK